MNKTNEQMILENEDLNQRPQVLQSRGATTIYLMEGMNRFSYVSTTAPTFSHMELFEVDKETMYPVAVAGRVRKTDREVDVIQ